MDKMIERLEDLSSTINMQIIKSSQKENLTETEKDLLDEMLDHLRDFRDRLEGIIYQEETSDDEEESLDDESGEGYLEESEVESDLE